MPQNLVRTAVIGVGLFGENHAAAYAEYHKSRLVCVCDVRADRAREVASRWKCDYTTDLHEIARSSEIDAVSVATPDFAHLEPCLAVLNSGKHLLVEKPLATSTAEAKQILEAARSRNLKLMVDFHNRWNPPFVAAKQEIDAGNVGQPLMAYARLSNPLSVPTEMLSWSAQSGPHWFLLPHVVDLIRWMFAQEAVEVYGIGRKGILQSRGIDTWDAIQMLVKFENAFATFETAWILPNSLPSVIDFKVNIVGSTGKISAVIDEGGLEVASSSFKYPFFSAVREVHQKHVGFVFEPIQHFVDCVAEDRSPTVTGEDGLAATAIIEAGIKSIESGMPTKVAW
jgi:predicted dehydrogenase